MQVILPAAPSESKALAAGVGADHHWHNSPLFQILLSRLQLHQAKSGQHSYPNNIVFKMASKQHRLLLYIATVILDVLCPALTRYPYLSAKASFQDER
jgi:hypothetical protein